MGQNEKFKAKKIAKKRKKPDKLFALSEDKCQDLAIPIIQVGVGLLVLVTLVLVVKYFVLF